MILYAIYVAYDVYLWHLRQMALATLLFYIIYMVIFI